MNQTKLWTNSFLAHMKLIELENTFNQESTSLVEKFELSEDIYHIGYQFFKELPLRYPQNSCEEINQIVERIWKQIKHVNLHAEIYALGAVTVQQMIEQCASAHWCYMQIREEFLDRLKASQLYVTLHPDGWRTVRFRRA